MGLCIHSSFTALEPRNINFSIQLIQSFTQISVR